MDYEDDEDEVDGGSGSSKKSSPEKRKTNGSASPISLFGPKAHGLSPHIVGGGQSRQPSCSSQMLFPITGHSSSSSGGMILNLDDVELLEQSPQKSFAASSSAHNAEKMLVETVESRLNAEDEGVNQTKFQINIQLSLIFS